MSQRASGTFAGLIDGTFGLLRHTWSTTLACGGVAFLPAAALYGWAYDRLFRAAASVWVGTGDAPFPFAGIVGPLLAIAAAALVQGLAVLVVRSCVTARAASAVRGGGASAAATAARTLRHAVPRLVGQRILQALVYVGVSVGVAILAMVVAIVAAGGLGGVGDAPGLALLPVLLCQAALLAAGTWLWVRFSLTLESVVIDGATAVQSFGLSASLVRRSWWRVFGWRLLFALMLGFAATLVATPVVFFATLKAYARDLAEMVEGTADARSLLDMFRAMGAGLPVRLAVFLFLQSLLNAFFAPPFMTLLYLAMKRRAAEAALPAPSGGA